MKKQFILLLMIVLFCAFQFACFGLVGPTDPDNPFKPEYLEVGWVTYTREQQVLSPNPFSLIKLALEAEGGSAAIVEMEKVGEQTWKAYVDRRILVNYPDYQGGKKLNEHSVYVIDPEIRDKTITDPNQNFTSWTGYGIYFFNQRIPRIEPYNNGSKGKFRVDKEQRIY